MLAFLAFRYLCVAFALVVSVLLGTGVLLRRRKEVLHQVFVLLAFALAAYQFSVFMAMSANTAPEARFWADASMMTVYLVSALLLFFSYAFLHNGIQVFWVWKYGLIAAATGAVTLLLMPGLVVGVEMGGLNPKVIYSRNFGVMAMMVTLNSLLAVTNFLRVWRGERGLRSAQAPYLMAGVLGFWVLGSSVGFLLPLLGIMEVEGLGASGAILMLLPIGYTIMRYRLFDVSAAARRLLTFAATSFVLAGIYGLALLALGFSFSLEDKISFRATIFPVLFSSMLAASLLAPVNRRVQEAMSRLFLRDVYDLGALTRNLSQVFRSISVLDRLLQEVLRKVCAEMGISDGRIFLQLKDTHRFVLAAREGVLGDGLPEEVSSEVSFMRHLEPGGDILIQEEWKRFHFDEESLRVTHDLERMQAHVAIPLGISNELTGFVFLGHKYSGHVYTQQDIDFFRVFASQLTIAIDNALLYSELRNDKLYQQTILNNLSSGVITVDLAKRVTACNKTAEDILGTPANSALGRPIGGLSTTFDLLLVKTLSQQRSAFQEEIYVQLQNGKRLPLSLNLSPLRDAEGKMIGGLIVFTDLSEIKQLKLEVRRTERLASLGTMAAGIAHEIKNPMVSIKTFTQLFPERYEDEEFRSTFYQLASHEIDRINTLVEHLLNLAKPANVTYEPISLPRVLREVLAMLETEFQQRQIRLIHDFQDEHVKSPADFRQMKQVFLNILLNAKESIQNGGTIEVRSCLARGPAESESGEFVGQAQHYLVQVADSGGGIAPEDLPHIFDPFFTTKTAGNGLGLSITHKIVTDHGGAITVDSGPGRTVFSVWLPIIFEEALVES